MKELIKDALVEMMSEKKGLFREILLEAIEDIHNLKKLKKHNS